MGTTNIESEKLDLITWISQLEDSSLIEKLKQIKQSLIKNQSIPDWQKEIVIKRILSTKNEDYTNWDEIENKIIFD